MEAVLSMVAVLTLLYLIVTLVEFFIGFQSIQPLTNTPALIRRHLPSVSIIFSALNEELEIAGAVESFLQLQYPDFEVIAINDRSKDHTGQILNALQARHPQLKVKHITDLPAGWFGKNHALYQGAQMAQGEWLLFTDADVTMKPDTLLRAMNYAMHHQLQHLTIREMHLRNSFWQKVLLLADYFMSSLALKPWRIRFRWSTRSLGHGAFNLVEKAAYQTSGSHAAIALECLDDLKLGAILKKNGFKQDTVDGRDYVARQWYSTLPEMIEGWKKNTFAFFDYNLFYMLGATAFALLMFIWPVYAACFTSGNLQMMNEFIVVLWGVAALLVSRHFRLNGYFALFYPLSILLLLYSIWTSMFAIYRQNGVIWRGTHYPLSLLKSKTG